MLAGRVDCLAYCVHVLLARPETAAITPALQELSYRALESVQAFLGATAASVQCSCYMRWVVLPQRLTI